MVLGPCRIWIYTFKWVFLWLRSLLSLLLARATFGADGWCLCVLRLFYTRPTCTALNSVTRTQNIARLAEWVRTISDWPEGNLFQVFFRKIKFVLFEFQVLVSFFHFCRSRWNFSIFLFFRYFGQRPLVKWWQLRFSQSWIFAARTLSWGLLSRLKVKVWYFRRNWFHVVVSGTWS